MSGIFLAIFLSGEIAGVTIRSAFVCTFSIRNSPASLNVEPLDLVTFSFCLRVACVTGRRARPQDCA
jgi:hypothetical protein